MVDNVETLLPGAAEADHALLTGEDSAPETPDVAPSEATQPEPTESGPARDDKGRFAQKADEPAPSPEEGAPAVADGEPVAPEIVPLPYKYAADGKDHEIEGAVVEGDWLRIPSVKIPEINSLLSEGHAWRGSAQRWFNEANQRQQQEVRARLDAETRAQSSEKQSQQILGHFEQLVEASRGFGPDQMMQSPLGQWLMDLSNNWGVLKAESKAAALQAQLESRNKVYETQQTQEREAQLRPQMESATANWILHYGEKAGLERPILEKLYAKMNTDHWRKVLFVKAEADDLMNGVRKGELAIDHSVIESEINDIAQYAKPKPATTGQPVTKPAPAPMKPNKVPPTVSATRGPAPQKSKWVPKSKQEADDALLYGHNDDD